MILQPKAFGISNGTIASIATVIAVLPNMYLQNTMYMMTPSVGQVLFVIMSSMLIGFIIGFTAGYCNAWVYNKFSN